MFAASRAFARVISPGVVFGRRVGDAATEETSREEGHARTGSAQGHVPTVVLPQDDAAAAVAAADAAREAARDTATGGEPSRRSGGSAVLAPAADPAHPRAPGARPSDATAGSREDLAAPAAGGEVASSGARKRRRPDAPTTKRRVAPRTSTRAVDSPCAGRRARGKSDREGVSRSDEAEARRLARGLARRLAIAQEHYGALRIPAPSLPTTDESAHVFISVEWNGATRSAACAPESLTRVRVAVGDMETCERLVDRLVILPPGASRNDARIQWGSIVLPLDVPVYGSTIDSTWRADANRPPTLKLRVPHGTALRHPDLLRAIGADANLLLGAEYAQGASHPRPRSSVVEKRELHGGGTNPASMVDFLLHHKVLSKKADSSDSVTVVDVGSGDGALARGIHDAIPRTFLVGIEIDGVRHEEAVKRHANSGVVFHHGAAEEILPACLAARVVVAVSRNFAPGTVSAIVRTAAELPCVSYLVLCESTLCTPRCKGNFGPCCCFTRMGSGEVEVDWGNTALGFTVYRRLLPWVVAVDSVPRVDEDGVDVSRLGPLAMAFEAEETSDGAKEEADEEEDSAAAAAAAAAVADADTARARAEADLARAEADLARAEAARSNAMERVNAATNATNAAVAAAEAAKDTVTAAAADNDDITAPDTADSDSDADDATDDLDFDGDDADDEENDTDEDESGSLEEEEEESGSGDDVSEFDSDDDDDDDGDDETDTTVAEEPAHPIFKCDECGQEFKSARAQRSLREHMRDVHGPVVTIECAECGQVFKSARAKSSLRNHMRAVHGPVVTLECAECGKVFKSARAERSLRNHMRNMHGPVVTLECAECGQEFKSAGAKSSLREHMRAVHGPVVTVECAECGQEFKSAGAKSSLREHMRDVHGPVVTLECAECGKVFKSARAKRSLRNHMRNKHGPKK